MLNDSSKSLTHKLVLLTVTVSIRITACQDCGKPIFFIFYTCQKLTLISNAK